MLHHRTLVPSLHFTEPSPRADLPSSPFRVNTLLQPWDAGPNPLRAGVSSFGFGGTNAHVILEEAPGRNAPRGAGGQRHLFPLSACSPAGLLELAKRWARFLDADPDACRLDDLAWTAQTGRAHFEHRLALVASSASELREKLAGFAAAGSTANLCHGSNTDQSELGNLAQRYVDGAEVNWVAVHGEAATLRRRTDLPTYPFARQRYWLEPDPAAYPVPHPEPANGRAAATSHPLLGRRLVSPLREAQFEIELNAESEPFLRDHWVYGSRPVPMAAFVEMVRAGLTEVSPRPGGTMVLENLILQQPLLLSTDMKVRVQTVLKPEGEGFEFQVFATTDQQESWDLHSSGRVRHLSEGIPKHPSTCTRFGSVVGRYSRGRRSTL